MSPKDPRDRLSRLEGRHNMSEQERDAELLREKTRRAAEHSNNCQSPGEDRHFVVMPGGQVFSSRSGRLIKTPFEVNCESLIRRELERGHPGLVHDPGAEAFYTKGGDLVLSRDYCNLEHLWGSARMEAWRREDEGEDEQA